MVKRNDWVYDQTYGNPTLAVPYEQLPKEEQEKDKAQIMPALAKIEAYKNGLVNVDELCEEYNISVGKML